MQFLGNTLEAIASEKAGIIKPKIPVVIGEHHADTAPTFLQKASENNTSIIFADQQYNAVHLSNNWLYQTCNVTDRASGLTEPFQLDLTGNYQLNNLKTVLAAEKIIMNLGFNIDINKEKSALQQVKKITGLRGRWDIISESPLIVADVAHNKAGIQEIVNQLKQSYEFSKVHFVIGFVKDKDVSSVLELFPKNAHFYFTNAHIERAITHSALKLQAAEVGLIGNSYDNVNEAIEQGCLNMKTGDVMIVCGSFFVVAEIDNF